jgi:serine/threonine protein kinase
MQHSSMVLFCDECGLANDPAASLCSACQHPLTGASSMVSAGTSSIALVTVAPRPVLEVTPGSLATPHNQSTADDFAPGTILAGRYQIQKEIGRGGFSVVYRAADLEATPRLVAIKRIQLNALTPSQIIDATETFNREVSLLPRFETTTGVPRFYEHLTDPENWYLVMEYIQGQTLEEYLKKSPGGYLKEGKVIKLGIALARILQDLHKNNPSVIFRDVKPANIMINTAGRFFLIDFGIARNFTFGKAKDTTPLGSPGYAPPEQYGLAQTDRRADIYSLGATLQTLITGRDPLELRDSEPSRNPKPPSLALRKLLDEMLSLDVTQRPVDMLYVQMRLESIERLPSGSDSRLKGILRGTARSVTWFLASYLRGLLAGLTIVGLLLPAISFNAFVTIICFLAFFLAISFIDRKKRFSQQSISRPATCLPLFLGFVTILILYAAAHFLR